MFPLSVFISFLLSIPCSVHLYIRFLGDVRICICRKRKTLCGPCEYSVDIVSAMSGFKDRLGRYRNKGKEPSKSTPRQDESAPDSESSPSKLILELREKMDKISGRFSNRDLEGSPDTAKEGLWTDA